MARQALLAGLWLLSTSAAEATTPLQKVLDLLSDMSSKGKAEKHAEMVEFAKFKEFCDDTHKVTTRDIKAAGEQIEELSADIAKAQADAEGLAEEIKELQGSVDAAQGELKDAVAVRKGENSDFLSAHSDFSESVDALEKAISTLKARKQDVPQSLLQLRNSPLISAKARATIESFLTMSSNGESLAPPEANAYEFQSGGVVEMLEKLRMKFKDQRTELEKSELNSKSNHELLSQKLSDQILEDGKRAKDKTARRAQRLEDAAAAKGDKEATEKSKAEDEKKQQETLATCSARSQEFEKNQVVRAEELKAIAQAVDILGSSDVAGAADKHLPGLLQVRRRGRALVQLRGPSSTEARSRHALAQFLQAQAKKLGSRYLSLVAEHSLADPFAKVKKMIKDLVVKLMEEANEEADTKAYCDAELAKNKQTREDKQAEVEELTATVEKLTSEVSQLAEDLSTLSDSVKESRKQQAEATSMRAEEKATNEETIAEAKAAQVAVERASKVLKDFYSKSAEASLVQSGAAVLEDAANAAPYTGMQSEHGGIVGFLEVILSDFARLEADTSSNEDSAQSAYDKFMDESAQDIAVKTTTINHKTDRKRQTENRNASIQKELALTQEELDAALNYYEKLKPDCLDTGLSYEERVRMRREEIQSLKEALDMLNQGDLA